MAQRPADDPEETDPAGEESSAPPALQVLFGARLRAARIAAGLTQAQVAERSGVNENYISRVEQGRRNLTLGTMTKLASVVGGNVSDMLREPGPPQDE